MNMFVTTEAPAARGVSELDFCKWLGQAAPGDVLVYHRGFLAADTDPHGSKLPERARRELARLARRAYWASELDRVHLVQRRRGPGDFIYVAVKTSSLLLEGSRDDAVTRKQAIIKENEPIKGA